jgi:hypothetical protein
MKFRVKTRDGFKEGDCNFLRGVLNRREGWYEEKE